MSSSRPDVAPLGAFALRTGDRLAELLSETAEAPDFAAAATFLVDQLAEVLGVRRACALTLDSTAQTLTMVASVGFPPGEPRISVPLEDQAHPLALATLSLCPVSCASTEARRWGLPFNEWLAVPFPQPPFRGAPPLLTDRRVAESKVAGCTVHMTSLAERRRVGHAPFGVVLLERSPSEQEIPALANVAMLAGPVLSRMRAVDDYRTAAERLDQRHSLLTAIVNSLPDPIVITDAANDVVVQNRRAEHLLETTDKDSEGRRRAVEINNLLFSSYLSKSLIGGGAPVTSRELNLVDPDEGTDLLFEVIAHPLAAEGGRDPSFVSVLRDVTDLRRASRELEQQVQRVRLAEFDERRERDRLTLILENVADPILVTDDQSNIILMNKQADELFQLGDQGAGHGRRAIAVRGNDTRFTTFISDFTISPARSRREQMVLQHPDSGLQLPVEVVSGKILNQRGEPMVIVSVLHDLTKQVENERLYDELKRFSAELEERIGEATADLEDQNKRLVSQARELERANRLKSDFLASMSHELRTPINALIGYTALMLDRIYGDINPKQEDGLQRIQRSAHHLLELISDILDLAKIEAGKMPLHLEDMTLRSVITEVGQQIEPMLTKKGLTFSLDVPPDAPTMHTDRTKVKQILLNLLSNAVKFTPQGAVSVRVVPAGERVRIEVHDTGIGIREQDLEAIWEDFRQVDQSRTREFGGTGLGLSITRRLVKGLGGEVSVTSRFGEGSTFTVDLPVRTRPVTPDDLPSRPVPSTRMITPRASTKVVE